MGLFDWITGLFSSSTSTSSFGDDDFSSSSSSVFDDDPFPSSDSGSGSFNDDHAVNPANGLPMVGGMGGVDVEGNPYGFDHSHDSLSLWDDTFSSSSDDSFGSSWDDSFGSSWDDDR